MALARRRFEGTSSGFMFAASEIYSARGSKSLGLQIVISVSQLEF